MKNKNYIISILTILLFSGTFNHSQERVKIATYNILNYPNNTADKNPRFKLILDNLNPDILVVQEILSQSAVNEFLNEVLSDEYKAGAFINGPDTDNAIFFKDSIFSFISTDIIPTTPRYISVFKLFHKSTLDTIIIYSAHFKASQGEDNENKRFIEATILRIFSDMLPEGTDFILVGDLNLYRSTEPAYGELLVQDGTGYFLDPISRPGNWHTNSGFEEIHTQSTRITQLSDDGSSGGLDDRFDFILASQSIIDPLGIEYVDGSYWAYGNDGQHFNLSIHDPPNQSVSTEIAIALYFVSDHLPVVADFDFGVVSGVEDEFVHPDEFVLYQNYPNPFNPVTTIRFEIPYQQNVELAIYDILGREVKLLYDGIAPAGLMVIDFNARGFSSGVYIYRLKTDEFISSKKLVILK
ncbi:MAG: T9SS type A sorting domain-containing protein [Bacteroidetes bacterium]|nr:T9SS type A sorting domain-containing protein [Bacteroidota bacterium]